MAALTATCFTYSQLPTPGAIVTGAGIDTNVGGGPRSRIENGVRITRVRIAMDNAAADSTYPSSGGIPLSSTPGDWGMQRNLDHIEIYGMRHTATGPIGDAVWKYDPVNHAVFGHWMAVTEYVGVTNFTELATLWMPTLAGGDTNVPVFYANCYGW